MSLDIQPNETIASTKAGIFAGEYLDSIKKTDLAQLTAREWQTFCEVMCVNYSLILASE